MATRFFLSPLQPPSMQASTHICRSICCATSPRLRAYCGAPEVLVMNPQVPAKTVPEFIAYAKANPGKINMATAGNGSVPHIAGEMFKSMTGLDLLTIGYRGGGPALIDLLAGRVQVMFEPTLSTLPYIRSGK